MSQFPYLQAITMKSIILFISIIALAGSVAAQRSISKSETLEQYRPLGELRVWTFIVKDSTVGNLVSVVKERTRLDGEDGLEISETLKLDYRKIGSPLLMDIVNSHTVSQTGYYLGDDMRLDIAGLQEKLFLQRTGDEIIGYSSRGEERINQRIPYPKQRFGVESNFMDQYELFLAMHDIKVGDTLVDSVFSPQSLTYTRISGIVENFINLRVYNEVFDSAFTVRLVEPQDKILYFTPDKRLIKAVIPAQDIKIYLDLVKPPEKSAEPYRPVRSIGLLAKAYLIYLVIGAISALVFVGRAYKYPASYIALVAGGILYVLMIYTQIPLQTMVVRKLFAPNVMNGSSPYLWGLFPAFSVGIIQELVKTGGILVLSKLRDFKTSRLATVGAILGMGFGIVEASYLAAGVNSAQLFGIGVLERAFTILFQTASGALLGYAFAGNRTRLILVLPVTIILNSFFRYLPVLVQTDLATPEFLNIALAFLSVVFVFALLVIFRRAREV